MAVYYTMGIDCGADQSLAERLVRHFNGFTITLPKTPPIICKADITTERGLWFVCVYPRGMGAGTQPVSQGRPGLISHEDEIRDNLYEALRGFAGYRRAFFGAEGFDQMAFGDQEEDGYGFRDTDFTCPAMISSLAFFPNDPSDCIVAPFTDGYRIVVSRVA